MILKQLKQLTLSATRRNAHLLRSPRLYTSPAAVSQTLATTTSTKPTKRLSKDDRRLLVESFVSKYKAANAGKFPTVSATIREVGGGFYYVRNILQELQLRPNPPVSRVPASAANDASSLKQDHTLESSHHPSSDEVSLQGVNNTPVITATHDTSETVTAPLDSKCDGSTHLSDIQTLKVSDECLKKSEAEEEGTVTQIASQEPRADHLQGANVLNSATHDKGETETDPPSTDVDSKCDGSSTHLPENQALKVADECLKSSETKDEGALMQSVSPEPKAEHLERVNVLPATHGSSETETTPLHDDADSKRDAATHLPGSQKSKVSEECVKNSETEEEGTLTHIASQKQKAEGCHEGGAASSNVLPTETRQVPEKGDAGEVKTGENSSAWSNIISFAKEFANFWRKG